VIFLTRKRDPLDGLSFADLHRRALANWRSAAGHVSDCWRAYRVAAREATGTAFAEYVAALDAEAAAAGELAKLVSALPSLA
jgi:hypothetical protein